MSQQILIEAIAANAGISARQAWLALDGLRKHIYVELRDGREVIIERVCRFSVGVNQARIYKNPRTGGLINVPTRKRVRSKVSNSLQGHIQF